MAISHAEHGKVVDLSTLHREQTSTIVKEPEFEVIRLVIEPDKEIPSHQVEGPVIIQCLDGTCTFFVNEEPSAMVPGSWLFMKGGTPHSVEAIDRTVLLVTILFPQP